MRRAVLMAGMAGFALLASVASRAGGDELWDLRPSGQVGRETRAKESVDDRYLYVARGSGGLRRARFVCEYRDRVIKLGPYAVARTYELSRKGEVKGRGEPALKKTRREGSSLKITRHGALFIPGLTKTPGRDRSPILDSDHVFLGRLARAILPDEAKEEGARWQLPTAELRRIFNADKESSELKGRFQVHLRSIKRRQGRAWARLDLKIKLAGKQKGVESRIRGKGTADFDLERGLLTELDLRYDYRLTIGGIEIEGERRARLKVSLTEEGSGELRRDVVREAPKQKAP